MCEKCKGHPACACPCVFVKDVSLALTVFFRGIPITQTVCRKCGHEPRRESPHKLRVGRRPT